MKRQEFFISGLLLFFAVFLFSYNLSWGSPYYFHPDERNIANSVSGLRFPTQLNPHFFAYGSLPLYAMYLTALLKNLFTTFHLSSFSVSFEDAIISSRILSNLLAYATIILLFFVGKKLYSSACGLLASFFGIFSVGFIQFAHFGTFEIWLTFFYLLLFYRFLFFLQTKTIRNYLYLLIIASILISIKISSLTLFLFPFFAVIILFLKDKRNNILFLIKLLLLSLGIVGGIFFITNMFVLLDFTSFIASMRYESSVATGSLPVFYTGGFFRTIPILYQLVYVYPFLLNPVMLLVGIISFVVIGNNKNNRYQYIALILFFLVYFLSQAFLFVKWIRYLIPTLPLFYLAIALFLMELKQRLNDTRIKIILWRALVSLCMGSSILWGCSYFITAFIHPDTRTSAAAWAKTHIPSNSHIISEAYDLGTLPFQADFTHITIVNFYDLETNPSVTSELHQLLTNSSYFILPSQRIIKSRITNPDEFPAGNAFYATVRESKTFEKVYETPCDIYCLITYLGNPIFRYEETVSVFDRPTINIYKIHER